MTIHHATVKRAAAMGFVLTAIEGDYAEGFWAERNRRLVNTDPKLVIVGLSLTKRFAGEYPAMVVVLDEDDDTGTIHHASDPENTLAELTVESDIDEVFASALEAAQADDLDPEASDEIEEEDDEPRGNVVAIRYKQEYAARGNPNNCGDWLAQTLEGAFLRPIVDGKKAMRFDVDAFTVCLRLNSVQFTGKWAALPDSGQKGWEGRYRMNGRQMLEKRLVASGVLLLHEGEAAIPVPADAMLDFQAKHPSIERDEEQGGE